jgi:hypothetical protein
MSFLDDVRNNYVRNYTGVCESCEHLVQVTDTAIGCEAHDKLILPEYPPYHGRNMSCTDWEKRKEQQRGEEMNKNLKFNELVEAAQPLVDYMKINCDPHETAIVTDNHVKIVRDEIGGNINDTNKNL